MIVSVAVESPVAESFRTKQIEGVFDVTLEKKTKLEFDVELPDVGDEWTIGAIVGPSGSGKTLVAREAYGSQFVERFKNWPASKSVVDGFDKSFSFSQITEALSAVGFASPPSWALPYKVLSNGQRFRCDLARSLLSESDVLAFDEFTSVVDRVVAKSTSYAVSKMVRRGTGCKKFVAVSCHYDILDWIEPDWVLDMASKQLARGRLRRPEIEIKIHRCNRDAWRMFGHHHYLSEMQHKAARGYLATWDETPVAYVSTLNNAGHKGKRIIHRLVVLPDYQGIGIGGRVLESVAKIESKESSVSIVTSHPALVRSLTVHPRWERRGRTSLIHLGYSRLSGKRKGSQGRATISFKYHAKIAPDTEVTV
jgi:GNAT superfamily N-acetyltransferase